ncbi:AMP-binding protein [Streptomyces sp. R35]|uniref:AMP-binding protein n=1 Tax=Streptomyces sp. R35 TaxID=3238630 RepID=A0AB39SDU0_9ACTN
MTTIDPFDPLDPLSSIDPLGSFDPLDSFDPVNPFDENLVIDLPVYETVLGDAAARGASPALVDGVTGRTVGYQELELATRRLAAGLADAGVEQGDAIALFSTNTLWFAPVLHACARAGAVVCVLDSQADEAELAAQLTESATRWLFTTPALLPLVRKAQRIVGAGPHPVEEIFTLEPVDGCRSVLDLVAVDAPEPVVDIEPVTDIAVVHHAVGSRRRAQLTHSDIAADLAVLASDNPLEPGERVLAGVPFAQQDGLAFLTQHALRSGATVVVVPELLHAPELLDAIRGQRVRTAFVTQTVLYSLVASAPEDTGELDSLERVICVGPELTPDTAETCAVLLGVPTIEYLGRQTFAGIAPPLPGA